MPACHDSRDGCRPATPGGTARSTRRISRRIICARRGVAIRAHAAAGPLEEALRNLDLVAWLNVDVLRRIAAKFADVVNCYLAPTQKPDPLLIGEIVESTRRVDGSEQRHVFRERNARRSAHGAPHVYKAEAR